MPIEPTESHYVGPDHQLPPPHADKSEKKHRAIQIGIWIVILLIFGLAFFLILRHKDAAAAPAGNRRGGAGATVTVTTVTARKGDIGIYLDSIGTITPVYTSSITSQVNGIITEVHYREGQLVHKGDPLIEIDPRPYAATLEQAQGTLQHDQGVLAQAQMDLERYRGAWAKNAIPKQTLDDQEKVVDQDQGTVRNDEGTVHYDQVQLGFCHIVSPITGRVGLRLIDPGNVVQSSSTTALAVVTQIQPITAIFTIAEDSLGQVQAHMKGNARLPVTAFDRSGKNNIASGTLLTFDNQIDTTTGTVKARASFSNSNSNLYPNQFVNIRLLVNTIHNATLIQTSAIQHNGQDTFVYVISDNTAHMKSVKTDVTDGDVTQVEGINPDDVLADSSFDKLQDNSKVALSNKTPSENVVGSSAP